MFLLAVLFPELVFFILVSSGSQCGLKCCCISIDLQSCEPGEKGAAQDEEQILPSGKGIKNKAADQQDTPLRFSRRNVIKK